MFSAEECPFGEESALPQDRPLFNVETPDNTNPEDVLLGSNDEIPFDEGDTVSITVVNQPIDFFVMDVKYFSTVPTRVTFIRPTVGPPIDRIVSIL